MAIRITIDNFPFYGDVTTCRITPDPELHPYISGEIIWSGTFGEDEIEFKQKEAVNALSPDDFIWTNFPSKFDRFKQLIVDKIDAVIFKLTN